MKTCLNKGYFPNNVEFDLNKDDIPISYVTLFAVSKVCYFF